MNTKKGGRAQRPLVTVDVLVFTVAKNKSQKQPNDLKIALVKRAIPPFKGKWALPGGFVKENEPLEDAAKRELKEEAGVRNVYLEQLYTFGNPERDPRTRVITVAYFALVPTDTISLSAATDVSEAQWFPIKNLPELAFDHKKIIQTGVERLRSKIGYSNIAYGLLPQKFRLSDLQKVYEAILGHKLDKRNFRRKMLSLGLLEETGQKDKSGPGRPALLYRFGTKEVVFFD